MCCLEWNRKHFLEIIRDRQPSKNRNYVEGNEERHMHYSQKPGERWLHWCAYKHTVKQQLYLTLKKHKNSATFLCDTDKNNVHYLRKKVLKVTGDNCIL